jgi:thiol-disulfide isomerase/thioredoxin
MNKIKIFGPTPPCARCKKAEQIAKEVASELGNVEVEKFDVFSKEADKYGIMMTPTIVVGEKVAFVGKVPTKEELTKAIHKNVK